MSSTNSIKSENKTNVSINLSDQMSRIRESVTKSIGEDLSLLKPNIDFSQFTQSMPELKKLSKNQSINEFEVKSKLDEINSKIESLDQIKDNLYNGTKDLDLLEERTNNLEKFVPKFKRMTNALNNKNSNEDNNQNRKQIEINDQKIDQLVETGQRIKDLQLSDNYLNKFKQ